MLLGVACYVSLLPETGSDPGLWIKTGSLWDYMSFFILAYTFTDPTWNNTILIITLLQNKNGCFKFHLSFMLIMIFSYKVIENIIKNYQEYTLDVLIILICNIILIYISVHIQIQLSVLTIKT